MVCNTAPSPIEALPAELIHQIFFYMNPPDVLSSRLVCTLFAEIGIDHHFENIIICFKRQHFQRLRDISQHPRIAKRVRSLHYHARRFQGFRNYTSWLHLPRCPVSATTQDWPKYLDTHETELQAAYQRYVGLYEDQEAVMDQRFDVRCFTVLFQRCRDLDTVIIDMSGHPSKTERTLPHTTFAEGLTDPICDTQWRFRRPDGYPFGVQPLYAISEARKQCAEPLRRLGLVAISSEAMSMQPRLLPSLDDLMHGLRELHISCYRLYRWTTLERNIDLEMGQKFCRDRPMGEQLPVHALNLEVLKVHFIDSTDLSNVLQERTWPNLRSLSIRNTHASQEYLEQLFLRHSESLEELSGPRIWCGQDDGSKVWHQVFRRVEHRMTKLGKVGLM